MNIIDAVREFIAGCPFIEELPGGGRVDFTDDNMDNYGICPTGQVEEASFLGGCQRMVYNFNLFARRFTVDDLSRLENLCFVERFSDWVRGQSRLRRFPDLGEEKEFLSISCANGFLFELREDGNTGLYQIQLQLRYGRKG